LCSADELTSTIDVAPRSSLCSSCGICGREYTSGQIFAVDAGPDDEVDGEGDAAAGTDATGGVCGSSALPKSTMQTDSYNRETA